MIDLPKTKKEAKKIGSEHYFTGKPCKRGHKAKRFTSNGDCIFCRKVLLEENKEALKERTRRYREANKEALKERTRRYREANKEALKERTGRYREANKDKIKERNKIQYEANKEVYKEKSKKRYEANKNLIKEQTKIYYEANKKVFQEKRKMYCQNNPEKIAAAGALRRARKANATPLFVAPKYGVKESKEQKAKFKDIRARMRDEFRAIYKEAQRLTKETGIQHHVDHIYPITNDDNTGLHVPYNLQILTESENIKKSNKLPNDKKSWHLHELNPNRVNPDPDQKDLVLD